MHWIFYIVGAPLLAVGIIGKRQLTIIAIALIVAGGVLHRRRYLRDRAKSAYVRMELMEARTMAPSGLHDRYEGMMTSLMGWKR